MFEFFFGYWLLIGLFGEVVNDVFCVSKVFCVVGGFVDDDYCFFCFVFESLINNFFGGS